MVKEGFMHIDISEQIKLCIQGKCINNSTLDHTKPTLPDCQSIQIQFELENNNEQNISHISICTVMKRSPKEVHSFSFVCFFFLFFFSFHSWFLSFICSQ